MEDASKECKDSGKTDTPGSLPRICSALHEIDGKGP